MNSEVRVDRPAPRDDEPHLRVLSTRNGRLREVLISSDGRLQAVIAEPGVTISRRFGDVTPPNSIALDLRSLRALQRACSHWAKTRDAWHAYFESSAGHPPGGFSRSVYFQLPGAESRPQKLGEWAFGKLHGQGLRGRPEVRPLATPIQVARGVLVTANVCWRAGVFLWFSTLFGVEYTLRDCIVMAAHRHQATLAAEGQSVVLEAGEEGFIRLLTERLSGNRR